MRVLVIDSYEGFCRAMEYCLAAAGFEVATVESAAMALARAQALSADVVLLDSTHAFDAGLRECRRLKRRPELARAAVVLLADRVTAAHLEQAKSAGAHGVIPKLFHWQELLAEFERLAPPARTESDQ